MPGQQGAPYVAVFNVKDTAKVNSYLNSIDTSFFLFTIIKESLLQVELYIYIKKTHLMFMLQIQTKQEIVGQLIL
jgi:hypothetical protein